MAGDAEKLLIRIRGISVIYKPLGLMSLSGTQHKINVLDDLSVCGISCLW